ncbi:hypothetical protein HPB47_016332 [Ixodes persulcatus]|uniref:Uncharacterized protein n=1 Tax=Ixodes persulcatus TaxID=34615 RepID=A0AC60R1T1_IXOPE|nr:hypothetical protein HPB47_016332 [Ixodes persulcatus]
MCNGIPRGECAARAAATPGTGHGVSRGDGGAAAALPALLLARVLPKDVSLYRGDIEMPDSWEKEEILSAMQQIESVSCVHFKERTNEESFVHILSSQGRVPISCDNSYLTLTSDAHAFLCPPPGSCFSEVGMSGLRQLVSLNFEVCATYGTIVHELLHVLGLWHEQSRADRDRYVRVVWNNVVPTVGEREGGELRVRSSSADYNADAAGHRPEQEMLRI